MQQQLEQYKAQAVHYCENALITLQQGDAEKAGELLWGSMAEAVKAVAARKGLLLRSHTQLRSFARALAAEISDAELESAYIRAEHLHSNFYEVFLGIEDLVREAEVITAAVRRLVSLAEQPLETLQE